MSKLPLFCNFCLIIFRCFSNVHCKFCHFDDTIFRFPILLVSKVMVEFLFKVVVPEKNGFLNLDFVVLILLFENFNFKCSTNLHCEP